MAITIGSTTEIDASGSSDSRVVKLTDTLAIVVYGGGASDPSKWYARTITISGTTLAPNTEVLVDDTSSDAVSDLSLVALTSTSAMVIYSNSGFSWRVGARILTVSGTTITVNAETALTDDPRGSNSRSAAALSSTSVIYTYKKLSDEGYARILSVSGTTITENAAHQITTNQHYNSPVVEKLTSSKAIISWVDTSSGAGTEDVIARVLTISGTSISSSSSDDEVVDSGTGHTTAVNVLAMAMLTGSTIAHVHRDFSSASELRAHILTISGTSISVGSVLIVNTAAFNSIFITALTSVDFATHSDTGSNFRVSQFSVSGTTITLVDEEVGEVSANIDSSIAALDFDKAIATFQGSVDGYIITFTGTTPGISDDEFTAAPMVSKPCDIDADGDFIYIGALASDGTPVLIKFSTALNADGSVVFEPGSGDNIGVECSRFDPDEITVAGQFDSTNVVERSEDAGSSFTVIDDGTIGGISAFRVGPDSDDRILVFDEDNSDLLETVDAGDNWTTVNASVSQAIKVIARLAVDVQQVVFGNSSADAATVTHSMSSGADIEELTGGDDPNSVDITSVVIN